MSTSAAADPSNSSDTDLRLEIEGSIRRDLDKDRSEEEVRARVRAINRAKLDRLVKREALRDQHMRSKNMGRERIDLDDIALLRPVSLFYIGYRAGLEMKNKMKNMAMASDSDDSKLNALSIENPPAQLIPGYDFIGIAQKGSNKTAAFVLQMLPSIATSQFPRALVLAPTRRRVLQIEEAVLGSAQGLGINVLSLVHRNSIGERGFGCGLLIATPLLLLDCLDPLERRPVLRRCEYVVLDEADRMIDMGFMERIMLVLGVVVPRHPRGTEPAKRVSMFTATMPPRFLTLARTYMRNPVVRVLD